jgi:hypothetical protein
VVLARSKADAVEKLDEVANAESCPDGRAVCRASVGILTQGADEKFTLTPLGEVGAQE